MTDLFMILISLALGGGAPEAETPVAAADASPAAPVAAVQAEPQVATGRFTTALEVKPILTATKANWVAVRDWQGQDLLYVTHLFAWRCGLMSMRVGVNDGPMQDWAVPPCHEDSPTPNALLPEDGLPYKAFAAGSITTVTVEVVYDDLSTDRASYERAAVQIP